MKYMSLASELKGEAIEHPQPSTQVLGYMWFFIRLAIIIGGIFGLYPLIFRSKVGQCIVDWVARPLMNRILREAPAAEEIFYVDKDPGTRLVIIEKSSKSIGQSVTDITAEGNIEILGIDGAGTYLTRPGWEGKVMKGDWLLVYADRKSVKRIVD